MAEICQAKKLRLGNSSSAASSSRGNGGGGGMYTQHRMLEELTRKCTCAKCRNLADTPMVTKCGHCLCEACAQQLRSADGDAAQCPECGQKVNADEVKRDYATGKLFNALQVLREHIRSQSSQPSLERARCADCLGRTIDSNDASGADGNGTDEQAAAAMATAAAMKRCESLHERLTRLADDGERVDEERRRLLTEAETELAQWRDRLSQQLNERHAEAARELEKVRAEAERLLAAAAERHSQARSGATELRRLLDAQSAIKSSPSAAAAAAAPLSEEALASLRMGESRAAELLARLVSPTSSEAAAADFELSRRSEPDALSSGFAALLAQAGVDLVIRPYPAANQPELRPVRLHRTGSLEPWDFGLLANTSGLWYTPDGEIRMQQQDGDSSGSSGEHQPLPSPCLIVNYKGFKTKRLHVFDRELREVARIRLAIKDGRLPGTIFVCDERQLIFTVDHSRCKVCQYDMTGRLVRKVGGSGTGPSQFRQPMSAYVHDDVLYVVDSDNKRVQMFHVETLEPKGSLTHDGFSTDLHSVLASDNRIVVTDRDHSKAFVFDRQSRALLREVALEGKPFTLTSDSTGNLFISLTNERKVQIFDAAMAHKLHSVTIPRNPRRLASAAGDSSAGAAAAAAVAFSGANDEDEDDDDDEDEDAESSSSSDSGPAGFLAGLRLGGASRGKPPFIYGVAFDSVGRRLFVADTFCHMLLAFQF
ncbi:hypothetical protein BOX15_Mlig013132g1 [Macrostomum lignano]|uniref:RING-type domain-containing protein n=1 Tax=Macrostomum lignano TaxID=282301 RepID=A0A267GIM2_9PLAT|nr:hypothetical protein BOX15_Mlig013132g1 [Macrostomum lignano]